MEKFATKHIVFSFLIFFLMSSKCSSSSSDDNMFALVPYAQANSFAHMNQLTESFLNNNHAPLSPIPEVDDETEPLIPQNESNNQSDDQSEEDLESDWEEDGWEEIIDNQNEEDEEDIEQTTPTQNMNLFPFMNKPSETFNFFKLGLNNEYQISEAISTDYQMTANELYSTYVQTGEIYLNSQPLENQLRLLAITLYWKINNKNERLEFITKFVNELLSTFTHVEAMMLINSHETLESSIENNLFLPFILNIIDLNSFTNAIQKKYADQNILTECVKYKNHTFSDIVTNLLFSEDIQIKNLTCINLQDKDLIRHMVWKLDVAVFEKVSKYFDKIHTQLAKEHICHARKLYIGQDESIAKLNHMLELLSIN